MTESIRNAINSIYNSNDSPWRVFLDKKDIEHWVEKLVGWLFRTNTKLNDFGHFEATAMELHKSLRSFLLSVGYTADSVDETADQSFASLPEIRDSLSHDLDAIIEFDPAAKSKSEVLLAYPGFFAIAVYRISHMLLQANIPILPRLMSEFAHSRTGIDIHPGALIGKRFFIDHGTGIVIGETCVIGDNVKIYQGVTLGALTVSKDAAMQKRHPTIEDNVTIYANATILGGTTVIGKNAVIGGNVWLTSSIPSHAVAFHKSDIVVKSSPGFTEAINFSI